ncbi:MAG: hypothetical protein QW197_03130 [Candidatus Aenigmatarchaeota archaeon]
MVLSSQNIYNGKSKDIVGRGVKERIWETILFHKKYTPFWRNILNDDDVYKFKNSLEKDDVPSFLEELVNSLYSKNPELLNPDRIRTEWKLFRPEYPIFVRWYQSSGTMGDEANISAWSYDDLERIVDFLVKHMKSIYEFNPSVALLIGPYGWFQEENTQLVYRSGAKYAYFVGVEVLGLKKLSEEEMRKRLEPTIKRIHQYLRRDPEIDTIRSAPLLYEIFPRDTIRHFITSGFGMDIETIKNMGNWFYRARIIPFYGDSMFGDAIGIVDNKGITYYPPDYVFIYPVRKKEKKIEIVEKGEEGYKLFTRFWKSGMYVFIDNKELIGRAGYSDIFGREGFSNPRR